MSYNHFFLFSSMRVKNTNNQRVLITRRAIISVWHSHPASTSSLCFVLASQELWEGEKIKTKVILRLSRKKSLAADFIVINASQLASSHILHSHCCTPSRSEVKAFFISCYFFKWVEDRQKKNVDYLYWSKVNKLTQVAFAVVKSLFGVSLMFLTGNAFWWYKHFDVLKLIFLGIWVVAESKWRGWKL